VGPCDDDDDDPDLVPLGYWDALARVVERMPELPPEPDDVPETESLI